MMNIGNVSELFRYKFLLQDDDVCTDYLTGTTAKVIGTYVKKDGEIKFKMQTNQPTKMQIPNILATSVKEANKSKKG